MANRFIYLHLHVAQVLHLAVSGTGHSLFDLNDHAVEPPGRGLTGVGDRRLALLVAPGLAQSGYLAELDARKVRDAPRHLNVLYLLAISEPRLRAAERRRG